jgi:chromosome segregation ATPase
LRRRLSAAHAEFEDLRCSAEMYQELCGLSQNELTLRQHVLIKVYEAVSSSRLATEGLRLELQEAKERLKQLDVAADEKAREVEAEKARSARALASAEQRCETVQDEVKRLEQLSNEYRLMVQELKDKGDRFDVVQNRVLQAEQERAVAREQADQALEAARLAREDLGGVKDILAELQQQVEILQVDKTYLARQTEQAQAASAQSERSLEREQDKVIELTKTIETLRQRLEDVSTQGRSAYEERLEAELKAHEQRNKKEVAELKEMHSQLLEREIRGLEREKHSIQEHLDRATSKLNHLEAEKTLMMDDHKARTNVLEDQVCTYESGGVVVCLVVCCVWCVM